MPICTKCGQQYDEGVRFCPSCGAPAGQAPQQEYQANANQGSYQQQGYQQQSYQQAPTQQPGFVFTGDKTMAILAVIFPILFFLPLVTGNKTEFDRFWANQSLLLLLAGVAISIFSSIFWVIAIIGGLLGLVVFVFWIISLVAVCKGEMKPLPLIGGIKIIQ
ncbi:MAG TPA: zinc-ribbon domain-containing protein [Clostridia bacterium]|nr:zinc-ribbon domain-containing protein [Clostridia bacterium]